MNKKVDVSNAQTISIDVQAKDIKEGKQASGTDCPIQRAVMRAVRETGLKFEEISVCQENVRLKAEDKPDFQTIRKLFFFMKVPKSVTYFVRNFDSMDKAANAKAKPFKFKLTVPRYFHSPHDPANYISFEENVFKLQEKPVQVVKKKPAKKKK